MWLRPRAHGLSLVGLGLILSVAVPLALQAALLFTGFAIWSKSGPR
jgi:hypothetical protein